MRKVVVSMGATAAVLAGAPASQACDMEGFGMGRFNPFGHQSAWGVPADSSTPQQSENPSILGAQPRNDTAASEKPKSAEPIKAADKAIDAAPRALAVSADTLREQARRFTATKD